MNRRQFIESQGATCSNWQWSWSFIDERRKVIIFGEWDTNRERDRSLILDQDWQRSRTGKRNPGYGQAREHIRLVEEEGWQLKTFPMVYSGARERGGSGPATIGAITPVLSNKNVLRIGRRWYATDLPVLPQLPEELSPEEALVEGAAYRVPINAYERNPVARARCLAHHGHSCRVCGFDFEQRYGILGRGYIHVHHLRPIGSIKKEYVVDPIKDLVPVCPNCHAMIHRKGPSATLSVGELRALLRPRKRVPPN